MSVLIIGIVMGVVLAVAACAFGKPLPPFKEQGITDNDLNLARWHADHGTQQFRDFLRSGESELTVGFARWLKERRLGTVAMSPNEQP